MIISELSMFWRAFPCLLTHTLYCTLGHTSSFPRSNSVSNPRPHRSILTVETEPQGRASISNTLGSHVPSHFMIIHGFGLPISLVHLFGQQHACLRVVSFLAWERLSKQCERFHWALHLGRGEALPWESQAACALLHSMES